MKNHLFVGLNSLITLVIGIITYKILWVSTSENDFSKWIALYELSIALLLLDLGFTQNFVKKFANSLNKNNVMHFDYNKLSNSLRLMGFIACTIVIFAAYNLEMDFIVCILMGLSVFFSLNSYSSQVILKIDEKFNVISIISIVSNIIYLLVCLGHVLVDVDFITVLAFGIFIRSIFSYFAQFIFLKTKHKINYTLKFNAFYLPDFKVVSFNFSYFMLYIFDIFILTIMGGVKSLVFFVVYKKYFEILRGVLESFLSIYMIKFAKEKKRLKNIDFFLIFLIFLIGFLSSIYVLPLWFSDFNYDVYSCLVVAINVMMIFVYRFVFMNLYFSSNVRFGLHIGSIFLFKMVIFSLIFVYRDYLFDIYFLHFLLMVVMIYILNSKVK